MGTHLKHIIEELSSDRSRKEKVFWGPNSQIEEFFLEKVSKTTFRPTMSPFNPISTVTKCSTFTEMYNTKGTIVRFSFMILFGREKETHTEPYFIEETSLQVLHTQLHVCLLSRPRSKRKYFIGEKNVGLKCGHFSPTKILISSLSFLYKKDF